MISSYAPNVLLSLLETTIFFYCSSDPDLVSLACDDVTYCNLKSFFWPHGQHNFIMEWIFTKTK